MEFIYVVTGEINQALFERFLHVLENEIDDKCDRLSLFIQSQGGSISIALAWAALLRSLPCVVTTYNLSNVDSAALLLFAAGTERICPTHGTFAFHAAAKEIFGVKTSLDLRRLADEIDRDTVRITDFLELCTGTAAENWIKYMHDNTVLCAQNALLTKLATSIAPIPPATGWKMTSF